MRRLIFGFLFLCVSLYANDIFYASSVKDLYESQTSSSPKGRVLPTSKVEVLGEVGNKYKVKISGYAKEGVENALYFTYKNRILVAGLAKDSKFEVISSKKVNDSNFSDFKELEIVAFVTKDDLSKDLNSLYAKAQELYSANCGICHGAHDKKEFTANAWPSVLKSMLSRTAISKEESYLVTQYLQKHSKDME